MPYNLFCRTGGVHFPEQLFFWQFVERRGKTRHDAKPECQLYQEKSRGSHAMCEPGGESGHHHIGAGKIRCHDFP
jgi:hypothetical protein